MAEPLFDPRLLSLRAAGARWLRDRRPADAKQFADGARVIVEQLESLGAEVERLRAAEQRVRDLHYPIGTLGGEDGALVCAHCLTYDGQVVHHLCPTIRALDGDAGEVDGDAN